MFSILGLLTGLLPALTSLANNITDLQKMKVKATSDNEIANINRQIEELHDKRQVLIAEAGSRVNAYMRGAITLIAMFPLAKIFVMDKTIGPFFGCVGKVVPASCDMFTTDALGTELWGVIGAIIGFYFLTTWKSK